MIRQHGSLAKHQSNRDRSRRTSARSLRVETLEDRRLLAAGALDPGFDVDGIATYPVGPAGEVVRTMALQPIKNNQGDVIDEKILVGGHMRATNNSLDFYLARYNSDGSPDLTFGTNGVAFTDFTGGTDSVAHLLITNQGKILAVGQAYSSGGLIDVGIAQYSANGVLDKTYGTKGKVTAQFLSGFPEIREYAYDAVLDNDRLIIVGQTNGYNFDGYSYSNYIARFNSGGSLDKTFGKAGKVVSPTILGSGDHWGAVTVSGTQIIVVGQENRAPTLGRFSDKGVALSKLTLPEAPGRVVFQADGQKFVGAQTIDQVGTRLDIQLVRFNVSNGEIDATFGTAGRTVTDFSADGVISFESASDVTFDAQGRILVAGYMQKYGSINTDFLLVRYDGSGQLDTSFGTGGAVVTPIGPGDYRDAAERLVVQKDGGILLSGSSVNPSNSSDTSLAMARYLSDEETIASGSAASSAEASDYDAALAALLVEEDVPLGRRRK